MRLFFLTSQIKLQEIRYMLSYIIKILLLLYMFYNLFYILYKLLDIFNDILFAKLNQMFCILIPYILYLIYQIRYLISCS